MSPTQHNAAEVDPSRPSLEDAIINPGAVKINVQGAYIVDDQPPTPESPAEDDGVVYERKDIRLPNHTSVVSHVAVDVSRMQPLSRHFPAIFFLALCEPRYIAARHLVSLLQCIH